MDILHSLLDAMLHVDQHLTVLVQNYGGWTYGLLFLIIFCETGLVVTPFLPGDSLLFAAGALAARGALSISELFLILVFAAVLGDSVNYGVGTLLGSRVRDDRVRFLKRRHVERTEEFFARYGGKTIVLARFVPIVRTYAPFVAGAARMEYSRFVMFNVIGGVAWVSLFLFGGFLFGNIPAVQEHFGLVVIAIILLSVLPMVIEIVRHRTAERPASLP